MKRALLRGLVGLIILSFSLVNAQPLFAVGSAGFENASYSARSLGQSNAVVARSEEPSTTAFNPAGLPDLKGVQVDLNLEGLDVITSAKSSVTHDREWDKNPFLLIPTGFITMNPGEVFCDRLGLGVGWTYPFGTSNRYESQTMMARYAGYDNQVKISALTLAGGIKLHEMINVGAAAVNYMVSQYDQTFNYPNSYVLRSLGLSLPDGQINTYQHGNAWGWTLGTLIKPVKHHQVGVYYRSHANVPTHGRAKVDGLIMGQTQGFDTTPYFETGIKSDIQLPSNLTVGYAFIPSEKWAVEVDGGWTGWSVFADQDLSFDRGNAVTQSLGRIPRNFHNTLSLNIGGHYKVTKKLDLLAGTHMYSDASPTENFDCVIPDSNRFGGTVGFTYSITKRLNFSTTGIAVLFQERSINNEEVLNKTGQSIDGVYSSAVLGFMSGFTYKFGHIEEEPKTVAPAPAPLIKEFPKP